MFGGTTWGQNNQQQQGQQGGGLFGGGGGFGQQQPQQPQQPQQNTGFGQNAGGFGQPAQQNTGGLFGSTNTNTTNTFGGGGGFGTQNAQQQNTGFGARPTFGAAGNTFGASNSTSNLFGNTANNNTAPANTFGQANNSGGLFGNRNTTAGTGFGGNPGTSTLFGARPTTTFGAPATNNPNQVQAYQPGEFAPPPATGTAQPTYQPTWQQDPSSNNGPPNVPPHLFHSIGAQDPYRGASYEELRLADYQQGRKNGGAAPAAGGFGQPATGGFGQPAPATNTFGQPAAGTSTFGAPKPAGGLFSSTNANTGFGNTGGGFGATNTNTGGLFGSNNQAQAATPFGGQNNTNAGGGLFGQPQPQQNQPTGGLFGNTNPFGSNNQQNQPAAANTSFNFGAPKPATTGFGTGTTGFGTTNTGATNTFGQQPAAGASTGFSFGQNQNQQQPAQTGGLFGNTNTTGGFGANNAQTNTGTGLFGNNQQQQSQPASTGLFGSTAAKPSMFGNTATNTGGGFNFGGQNNAAPAQPAAGSSLFGNTNTGQSNTGMGLFGQPQQQQQTQQPAAGTGLFGNTGGSSLFAPKPPAPAPTGGLFGSTQTAQPAQTGTGLFGNTANTGSSLFGNNAQNQQNQAKPAGGLFGGGSLFGQQPQQPQQNAAGGSSLFGNLNQPQAQTSLFGSQNQQQPQQPALGGSLFGNSFGQSTNQQQQPQGTLTASIDQNPYGKNELFNYTGQKLDLGSSIKKPALPPHTTSSFRVTPTKSQLNKLRGFSTPLSASQGPSSPVMLPSPNRSAIASPSADRYKGLSDAALTINAFVPRPSIKKLTVHPRGSLGGGEDKLESVLGKSQLRSSTGTPRSPAQTPGAASPGTILFNPPANGTDTPSRPGLNGAHSLRASGSEPQPKKGEYWCKPPLEKLKRISAGELRSLRNFVAGRKGYGEVHFNSPVDLTGLDLDTFLGYVVIFSQSELSIYADDYPNKPTVGNGLNQPARVTLESVFSKDKSSKQFITDPEDARYTRFVHRVKNIPNTSFVSYDGGVWTFDVEHFSKYGIADSDEEEEVEASQTDIHNDEEGASRSGSSESDDDFLPPNKGLHDIEEADESESSSSGSRSDSAGDEQMDDDRSASDTDKGSFEEEEEIDLHPPPEPPTRIYLNSPSTKKVREMQSSFFANPPTRTIDPREEKLALHRAKRMFTEKEGFEYAGEEEGSLDHRPAKRTSFGTEKEASKVMRQPRKYARVALAESSVDGNEGVRADAGLALGRSFRCSWGPNGELVHFGKICRPTERFQASPQANVVIETVGLLADETKVETARAKRLLKLHLERTRVELVEDVPAAYLDPTIRFRDFTRLLDSGDRSHEASIWRLGLALFDEIELHLPANSSDDLVERITEIRRKLALSRWLEDAVAGSIDHDLLSAGGNAEKIFILLSGNQLERAVQTALDGGDMRLATLVSQAGGSELFREEIMRQLEDWKKYKANPLISTGYRRIYALLAGIMDVSPGDPSRGSDGCSDVIISDKLDWKRAFGLRLWYGNPFEQTIPDVLATFSDNLKEQHPPAKPLPAYLEKPSPLVKEWSMSSEPTDILFGLIKLYSDVTVSLEDVLRARDCSPSPLDARMQWHLYTLLALALGKRDFADRDEGLSATANSITSSYAAQLEEGGNWTDAAFVLLHIEANDSRATALRALLHRHPDPTFEERSFLVDTLLIPEVWLHEAKAAALASSGEVYAEFKELIAAGLYERAHRNLVDKLALEAIVRGDNDLLGRLCDMLEGAEPEGWEYGGKLFVDYLDVVQNLPAEWANVLRSGVHSEPAAKKRVQVLANSIPRIVQLLPALFPNKDDPQQVAALSEMLSELTYLGTQVHFAGLVGDPLSGSKGLVNLDRLQVLQETAYNEFEKTLGSLSAAA